MWTSTPALAVYSLIALVAIIAAAWWRFIESPSRQADDPYAARHELLADATIRPHASAAQYHGNAEAAEIRWRRQRDAGRDALEDVADEAYADYLHRLNVAETAIIETWWEQNAARWQAEQDQWRRSLQAGPPAVWAYLAAGTLADPWWTRRR